MFRHRVRKCTAVPGLEPGTYGLPVSAQPTELSGRHCHIFTCLTKIRAESLSTPGRLRDLFLYFFMLLDTVLEPQWPPNITWWEKCKDLTGLERSDYRFAAIPTELPGRCLTEIRAESLSPLQAGWETYFHTSSCYWTRSWSHIDHQMSHGEKKCTAVMGTQTLELPFQCSTDQAIRPLLSLPSECGDLFSKGSNPEATEIIAHLSMLSTLAELIENAPRRNLKFLPPTLLVLFLKQGLP